MQCRYEEVFRQNKKYWCGKPCLPLVKNKIVETTESQREVRRGRVTIRDHPVNLTFTVTLENLTESDGGTYWCGIDVSLIQRVLDPSFKVVVTVSPGELHAPSPCPSAGLPDLHLGTLSVRTDAELKSWVSWGWGSTLCAHSDRDRVCVCCVVCTLVHTHKHTSGCSRPL